MGHEPFLEDIATRVKAKRRSCNQRKERPINYVDDIDENEPRTRSKERTRDPTYRTSSRYDPSSDSGDSTSCRKRQAKHSRKSTLRSAKIKKRNHDSINSENMDAVQSIPVSYHLLQDDLCSLNLPQTSFVQPSFFPNAVSKNPILYTPRSTMPLSRIDNLNLAKKIPKPASNFYTGQRIQSDSNDDSVIFIPTRNPSSENLQSNENREIMFVNEPSSISLAKGYEMIAAQALAEEDDVSAKASRTANGQQLLEKPFEQCANLTQQKSPVNTKIPTAVNQPGIIESSKAKIPRPPNAFMIFANEWRKHIAKQYPRDSNKTISVRLGQHWKTLPNPEKESYYIKAKKLDSAHKRKYPDYTYNPKEARARKAQREAMKSSQRAGAGVGGVHVMHQHQHAAASYQQIQNQRQMLAPAPLTQVQYMPSFTSQQTIGGSVGSISGGGIISGASGSRTPSATPGRGRPPPYPGTRYSALDQNRQEFGMSMGSQYSVENSAASFNHFQQMYGQPTPSAAPEPHHAAMFDPRFSNNVDQQQSMWSGMQSNNSLMWQPSGGYNMQAEAPALNEYNPYVNNDVARPPPAVSAVNNSISSDNQQGISAAENDFPEIFSNELVSDINGDTQKRVLDLVVANELYNQASQEQQANLLGIYPSDVMNLAVTLDGFNTNDLNELLAVNSSMCGNINSPTTAQAYDVTENTTYDKIRQFYENQNNALSNNILDLNMFQQQNMNSFVNNCQSTNESTRNNTSMETTKVENLYVGGPPSAVIDITGEDDDLTKPMEIARDMRDILK